MKRMRWQRLVVLVLAYVIVDLADPFPGAFEFEAGESVEAVHAARSRAPDRADSNRTSPEQPRHDTDATLGTAAPRARARRALTDWLARSRPAHEQTSDAVPPAPSEDH
jgi:hypothetical protein